LRGYLEAGNKKRKATSSDVGASVEASGLPRTVGTLCADTHPGAYSGQDAYTGRLIPVSHWEGGDIHPTLNQAHNIGSPGYSNQEVFSQKGAGLVPCKPVAYILDSFTSNSMLSDNPNSGCRQVDMTKCLDTSCLNPACHQGGVMINHPIPIQDGREIEKNQNGMGVGNSGDPAYTIDTTGAQAAAIPFRKSKRACSTTDNETWVPADASNTLNNFDLGDTRTTHAVVQPVAIQGTIIGRGENAGPQGTGATEGGPMFTLTKTDVHGVSQNMAVRRLTPVECERLQGFPDNWSRIPWKGKPEEECPDGPRYKACGNSMAVPVMRWIGERIAAYELSQNHETK
jgi:DNA (cytosine-5)-methyltransferase 1